MQSKITKRILAEAGTPRLLSILADDLAPSDLQSLLLMVYRQRVQAIREAGVLGHAERSSLLKPADVDARVFNTFDRIAFAAAAGFDALDLSPVCPLGTNHALGGVDQNNVLTTIRNAEVLGDSTPAMALEAARRRKAAEQRSAHAPVRLCSSHRVVRLQRFDFPGFTPHFRLFGLATAGRDTGSSAFEIQHLREHIGFYLSLFRGLNAEGFSLANPLVEISDLTITEALLAAAGSS